MEISLLGKDMKLGWVILPIVYCDSSSSLPGVDSWEGKKKVLLKGVKSSKYRGGILTRNTFHKIWVEKKVVNLSAEASGCNCDFLLCNRGE